MARTSSAPIPFGNIVGLLTSSTAKVSVSLALLIGVLFALARNYDLSKIIVDIRELTPSTIAIISVSLLANALAAAVRFRAIAGDLGHTISLRRAMATVSAGSLAGALFFQLAGQLIARGTFMGRSGVPFANVVVITLYERVVAAIVSGLIAVAGAYLVFGRIYINLNTGGADLIRLMGGLIAAATVAALIGYGRTAATAILPLFSQSFARSLLRVLALTIIVQIPMMVAYVAAAHALSPAVPLLDITAASAIVMFTASVPITLERDFARPPNPVCTRHSLCFAHVDAEMLERVLEVLERR